MTDEADYVVLRSPLLMRDPWIDRARHGVLTIRFPTLTETGLRYVDVHWADCHPTADFECREDGMVAQVWKHEPPAYLLPQPWTPER